MQRISSICPSSGSRRCPIVIFSCISTILQNQCRCSCGEIYSIGPQNEMYAEGDNWNRSSMEESLLHWSQKTKILRAVHYLWQCCIKFGAFHDMQCTWHFTLFLISWVKIQTKKWGVRVTLQNEMTKFENWRFTTPRGPLKVSTSCTFNIVFDTRMRSYLWDVLSKYYLKKCFTLWLNSLQSFHDRENSTQRIGDCVIESLFRVVK